MINNIQLEVMLKNLNDEELKEIKTSIETELRERKERQKKELIKKFTDTLSELQKNGIDVYFEDVCMTEDYLSFDY